VSAEDKGTGNRQKIVITNDQNRLKPEDIERMYKDAEKYAEEDRKLQERVESKNDLESYVYSLKNQLNDKDKLGAKVCVLLYRVKLRLVWVLGLTFGLIVTAERRRQGEDRRGHGGED